MNRSNRPTGRQKRVGSGTGNVYKRGSGLSGRTGGPVGGGYSGRTGSSFSGSSGFSGGSGGSNRPGGYGRGSGGLLSLLFSLFFSRGRSSGKLITLIILGIGAFLWFKSGDGNFLSNLFETDSYTPSLQGSSYNSVVTYVDNGPYNVNKTVSEYARDKYTRLKGNGNDVATIMIYLCGTDLETKSGMASNDLEEILRAEISDNVNIIVETGGTLKWQNKTVSGNTNQRFQITRKGLKLLEKNLGKKSMVDTNTLTDFIKYCKKNFPADRYSLIMWDHGGGSLNGFGYDQIFPGDAMTLDEIATALKNSNCTFDWVGFDACLMATLETAVVLEPYADYMIASEEVEPGIGWYYTNWISALSQNPSISTADLGKKIIDDYVKEVKSRTPQSQATLSLVDLSELNGTVLPALAEFSKSTNELIYNDQYKVVSDARAGAKEFAASSKINQIDLVHFAENIGTNEAKSLSDALKNCIKYNRTSTNISNSNGLSVYFPYGNTKQLNTMLNTYDKIGIEEEYSDCIKSFANMMAGGQITTQGSGNILDVLLDGVSGEITIPVPSIPSGSDIVGNLLNSFLSSGDYSSITGLAGDALGNWLNPDRVKASADYYKENRLDASSLAITKKGGQRVLSLTEDQWDMIQFMEMNVFIDDGEGFIDLGLDNIYEYNDDGDLIMEYDGTWLALNGHIVAYYMVSEDRNGDQYTIKGRVPALLNDQLVDIIIVFDNQNPYGNVIGAQLKYDPESQTDTVAKGLIDIATGDKIDYLCDYYTYDGEYTDTYFLGDQYTATGEWEIENISVGNKNYQMAYRLTDIYGNRYWTPTVND